MGRLREGTKEIEKKKTMVDGDQDKRGGSWSQEERGIRERVRYPHGLFSASDAVLQPTFFFLLGALLEIQLHPQTMQRRSEFLSPRERVYSTASFEIIFEYSCCVLQKKEMKGYNVFFFSPTFTQVRCKPKHYICCTNTDCEVAFSQEKWCIGSCFNK